MRPVRAAVAVLLLALATAAQAQTKRILLLYSFGRDVEAHAAFARSFRIAVASESEVPPEFFEISLATAFLRGGAAEGPFLQYLQALDAKNRFDLVVSVGGPAARFIQRNRGVIFASTPMLIAATESRHLSAGGLSRLDAAVPVTVDLRATFENILRVRPRTKEILVVLGRTPLEQFWADEIRKDASAFEDRVRFSYLDELPFSRILERAAAASDETAIFFVMMLQDVSGVPYGEESGLAALSEVTRAPIFGVWDYQIGRGAVGGPVMRLEATARQTAGVARAMLDGKAGARLVPGPLPTLFAYDARELARWEIPRRLLPPGSEVRFERPSFWNLYPGRILAVVALCLGQGALIVWLYASRRRVRLAQEELRDVTSRLVAAQEEERARLARELHDDVTQRLARLAIDAGRAETTGADAATLRGLREGLVALSEGVHALSYSLHPSILDDLGLVEAVQAECDRVAEQSALSVELVAEGVPVPTPTGAARCLYRVAQEAMRNVVRHAQARRIDVGMRRVRDGLRLTVRDDGVGFDLLVPRTRRTLGLASMRERVHVAGGKLTVESAPGRGTTVTAWVPLEEPTS